MKTGKFQLHGKVLRYLRMTSNLKANEVAKSLKLSCNFISYCENDKRKLSEAKTNEFLELVGVSLEDAKDFYRIVENKSQGGE